MTQKRCDAHSTEFGLWLREQAEIDSSLGFATTNIDYVWHNYRTGQWMFIEEKRHNKQPAWFQEKIFQLVDKVARLDKNYCGFHVLVFENTNPEDGRMWLDHKSIEKADLLAFLTFVGI